jgi:hypothetical protein
VAVVGGLTRGMAKSQRKLVAVQAAITGTGAITSGLSTIDAGSAQLTVQNSATTVPTGGSTGAVTSISTGTVNTVVIDQQAAANVVAGGAKNVGLLATGQ